MRVLGIDPGSQCTGFGVLDAVGPRLTYVASGVIRTAQGDFAARLWEIFRCVQTVVAAVSAAGDRHRAGVRESQSRQRLKLGQARGAAICGTADANAEVFEYATRQIKQAVVGSGQRREGAGAAHDAQHAEARWTGRPPMRRMRWPPRSATRCAAGALLAAAARRAADDRLSQGPPGGQAAAQC